MDLEDIRVIYEGNKKTIEQIRGKSTPPKTKKENPITDLIKLSWSCLDHYSGGIERGVFSPAVSITQKLNSIPTETELSQAIDKIACGRAGP